MKATDALPMRFRFTENPDVSPHASLCACSTVQEEMQPNDFPCHHFLQELMPVTLWIDRPRSRIDGVQVIVIVIPLALARAPCAATEPGVCYSATYLEPSAEPHADQSRNQTRVCVVGVQVIYNGKWKTRGLVEASSLFRAASS